jgi:hypothetical protein
MACGDLLSGMLLKQNSSLRFGVCFLYPKAQASLALGYKKQTLHLPMQGFALSEWGDLNSRPLDPQSYF